MNQSRSRRLAVAVLVVLPINAAAAACQAPPAVGRPSLPPLAMIDASLPPAVDASPATVAADAAVDPCATLFSGPHYDVLRQRGSKRGPAPTFGQPATLPGAKAALCGRRAECSVVMLLPAGRDDQAGEDLFVSRVDSWPKVLQDVASGCGTFIDYFLVVAKSGRISRVRHLVETGETCMHWRGQQVTVGPDLFVWRDSGYGSPCDSESYKAWERSHYSIDLSTLRVNGCAPPPDLDGPLVPHPFA